MRKSIALRADYDAAQLYRLARTSEDAAQVQRLLALAVIYGGGSRTEAAEFGGVTLQVVRDWVLRLSSTSTGLTPRLRKENEVTVSKQTLSRELRAMGYRKLSASSAPPPRHWCHRQWETDPGRQHEPDPPDKVVDPSDTAVATAVCSHSWPNGPVRVSARP
jgi:hypothetical protein